MANYPFGIDGKHIVIIRASPEKVRVVEQGRDGHGGGAGVQ